MQRCSHGSREPGDGLLHALIGCAGDRRASRACSLAWWFYIKSPETPKKLAASLARTVQAAARTNTSSTKFTPRLIVRPLLWISTNVLWHVVDEGVIDGTVNGVGHASRANRASACAQAAIRQHAQLRHVGRPGRGGLHYPAAALDGATRRAAQPYLLTVLTFLPLAERRWRCCCCASTITSGFAAWRWPRRVAEFAHFAAAAARLRLARRRLPVRGIPQLDSAAADSLPPGRGRHQPVSRPADHVPDADRHSVRRGNRSTSA